MPHQTVCAQCDGAVVVYAECCIMHHVQHHRVPLESVAA